MHVWYIGSENELIFQHNIICTLRSKRFFFVNVKLVPGVQYEQRAIICRKDKNVQSWPLQSQPARAAHQNGTFPTPDWSWLTGELCVIVGNTIRDYMSCVHLPHIYKNYKDIIFLVDYGCQKSSIMRNWNFTNSDSFIISGKCNSKHCLIVHKYSYPSLFDNFAPPNVSRFFCLNGSSHSN